ncbi:MAG: MarR family transcriptional regulator [Oscillospiraceae bacterium]|nr:MarR family transcriptional regulator [Oscillospiraceae bacterium]
MNDNSLLLSNQLCFPLYACAKEVVRHYRPFLEKIGLTYTQYITMMLMWEHHEIQLKELGKLLYLDSGTLSPLLKKMEEKGLVTRERSKDDERDMIVTITEKGMAMKADALCIPHDMGKCMNISPEDAQTLYRILYTLLYNINGQV